MSSVSQAKEPLSWSRSDLERRLFFPGAKYTGTNSVFTFLLAVVATVVFYAAMFPFERFYFVQMFYERGPVPYVIAFFSAWCLAILFVKWRKLALQKRALRLSVVPQDYDFVLSPITAEDVLKNVYAAVDDPSHFVLLNRIVRALSNLRNIGRISDVDDMLRSQAENDESQMESSYSLARGFIWAIPVLGFIGTVLGLSKAIGGFGNVLASGAELEKLKMALQHVTGGLAIAFETTLIGLVGALIIQLLLTVLKKAEEQFLDDCEDYCHRNIVSKLRILSLSEED